MLYIIDVNTKEVTLFYRAYMRQEYYLRRRRRRSRLLKKVGGRNCPYVQGLWCRRGKNCYEPACDYARTVNAKMDDGCYGYVTSKTTQHRFEGETLAKQASITVKLVKEAEAKDNEELAEEIKRELELNTTVIPWAEEIVKVEVK